jgi:hypothetical protein
LSIGWLAGTSGGIAVMSNANIPFKSGKVIFGEGLGNQPHFLMYYYFVSIANSDASAFLPTMLKSKKSEKDKPSYIYL